MAGWELPFDLSMIGKMDIAVNCPSKEMFNALRSVLDESGVRYASGKKASDDVVEWEERSEDFCFYVSSQKRLWHGPRESTNHDMWSHFQKCTFCGYEDPDIPDVDCEGQELFDLAYVGVAV